MVETKSLSIRLNPETMANVIKIQEQSHQKLGYKPSKTQIISQAVTKLSEEFAG